MMLNTFSELTYYLCILSGDMSHRAIYLFSSNLRKSLPIPILDYTFSKINDMCSAACPEDTRYTLYLFIYSVCVCVCVCMHANLL